MSEYISLKVWTDTVGCVSTKYLTPCFYCQCRLWAVSFIGAGTLWNGRDFNCFCILDKGTFLEDDNGFKVAVVCHCFFWVSLSNYLWWAQRKGDGYSQESKIEFHDVDCWSMYIFAKRTQSASSLQKFWHCLATSGPQFVGCLFHNKQTDSKQWPFRGIQNLDIPMNGDMGTMLCFSWPPQGKAVD